MGAFLSNFVSIIGELAYSFPAALIVFLLREWFRNALLNRFSQRAEYTPLYYVDGIAVGVLALWGVSWGGMIQSKRYDNFITFLASQLFYILLFFIVFFYLQLNKPEANSYSHTLFVTIGFYSFVLFLLNFIPLPPFDLSFLYMQDLNQIMTGKIVLGVFKAVFVLLCFLQVIKDDFFFKQGIISFLSPGN